MVKIDFICHCNRPPDELDRCADYAKTLGLAFVREPRHANVTPLAILGGGPSINDERAVLCSWPGEMWAINGAIRWAAEHAIDATFFTIDPETTKHTPTPHYHAVKPKAKVLASVRCPEIMFDDLMAIDADIQLFDLHASATGMTIAIKLAAFLGYSDVTLFGGESSYREREQTHAYEDFQIDDLIRLSCNGGEYLTKPELLFQAEYLATMLKEFPTIFHERSGGLLRALVGAKTVTDYDIIGATQYVLDNLTAATASADIGAIALIRHDKCPQLSHL